MSGKRSLAHWLKVLKTFADQSFEALCGSYPLVGQGVLDKERARLLRDLESFLEYDAKLRLTRFVAVERAFDGVALDAGGTSLHVRGYIDRLDVEGDHALVRDLKTGQDHPRIGDEADPTPVRDVQLGLYGLVTRKLAARWGIPGEVQAAYVYARGPSERGFRKDHVALEAAAKGWLAVAAGLLSEHSFPPTPREEDCAFCPFAPVCGAAVQGRAPPGWTRRRAPSPRSSRPGRRRGRNEPPGPGSGPGAPRRRHPSRGVNVLVDAGAGTGKTTLLVARLVEMVAPSDDSSKATPLERVAAVTFTRKAAGELKLRVREKLLSELAGKPSPLRRDRLSLALAAADTAFIGTIHGFSDRLLRRRPVEARLSPSYEILEDASGLTHEAFEILLQASEAGRLADELAGTSCPPERAEEAQDHIRAALAAEVRAGTKEGPWRDRRGLDALFDGFLLHRDVPPRDAEPAPFPAGRVGQAIREFLALARESRGVNPGRGGWPAAGRLERLAEETDPVVLFREVSTALAYRPGELKSVEFEGDPAGWEALKAWDGKKDEPASRRA